MEQNTIGIRTDANQTIGMGHLMRCMSIARQLKKLGQRVIFLVSGKEAETFVCQNGFSCLLVDSYEIAFHYMQELKKRCKTVYLDDLGRFEYPVSLCINYTYGLEQGGLESLGERAKERNAGQQSQDSGKHMFGIRYAPLREEFSGPGIFIRDKVENIYITTGGADPYHMLVSIVKGISFLQTVKKHVVAGKFYQDMGILEKWRRKILPSGFIRIFPTYTG